MQEIINANKALKIQCLAPYYPYNEKDNFIINLKKGKNNIKFKSEDHFNSFIQASESLLMEGQIIIGQNENVEQGNNANEG